MTNGIDSANVVDAVYGDGLPELGDPAENYFEASKIHEASVRWDLPGARRLSQSAELREMATRAGRRYASRPLLPLVPRDLPPTDLSTVILSRRSATAFDPLGGAELPDVAAVLRHGYGLNEPEPHRPVPSRPVPSAGALYPLDLYLVSRRVDGLTKGGLYHFDPFRSGLANLQEAEDHHLENAFSDNPLSRDATFVVIISASFWRSRFKYGQRALRFVLMEAGHVAQNLTLTAAALGLASRCFGGFLDEHLTAVLTDHNGVDDAAVYAIVFGRAVSDNRTTLDKERA